MPLPKPNAGESRDDFVGRCMSAMKGEDKPHDQKVAICMDGWREAKKRAFEEELQSDEEAIVMKFSDEPNFCSTLIKVEDRPHFVLAPVLVPGEVDRQGDIVDEEEIQKAAHRFVREMRKRDEDTDFMHRISMDDSQAALVESFISPVPIDFGDGVVVKAGTWLTGWEIHDKGLWSMIQKGQVTGLSIFGTGESEAA